MRRVSFDDILQRDSRSSTYGEYVFATIKTEDTEDSGNDVTLKIAKTNDEVISLLNEFDVLQDLHIDGVEKLVDPKLYIKRGKRALIFKKFEGQPLDANVPWSVEEFLPFAIRLCDVLQQVHDAMYVHGAIKPSNVYWLNENGKKVITLINFGDARRVDVSTTHQQPSELEVPDRFRRHSLGQVFSAPEQLWGLWCYQDFHIDIYSAGVLFFKLLTGRLPFEVAGALRVGHAQIAMPAPLVTDIDPNLPSSLAQIVDRLLQKNISDRYHRAAAVMKDLQLVADMVLNPKPNNKPASFSVGLYDVNDQLRLDGVLYGRSTELDGILQSYLRCKSKSVAHVVLVSGAYGMGKTALLQEARSHFVEQGSSVVSVDSSEWQQPLSFATALLASAITACHQLETASSFLERLSTAVDVEGIAILQSQPVLKSALMGKFDQKKELEAITEASEDDESQLTKTMLAVWTMIAAGAEPLVLLCDNIELADASSLRFLAQLAIVEKRILLLASTSLDKEALTSETIIGLVFGLTRQRSFSNHPSKVVRRSSVRMSFQNMEEQQPRCHQVTEIELNELSLKPTIELVSHAVFAGHDRAKPLAEVVLKQSCGNPYYMKMLLRHFVDTHTLEFNSNKFQWEWLDPDVLVDMRLPSPWRAHEHLVRRLQRISEGARRILAVAACCGLGFNTDDLPELCGQPSPVVFAALAEVRVEGVLEVDGHVRHVELDSDDSEDDDMFEAQKMMFSHNYLRLAAAEFLSEAELEQVHYTIGKRHCATAGGVENMGESVFEAVHHLNLAQNLLTEEPIRCECARMNSLAAKLALAKKDYDAARTYLEMGLKLMDASMWKSNYDLMFSLHVEMLRMNIYSGDFSIKNLSDQLLAHSSSTADKAVVHSLHLMVMSGRLKNVEPAIQTALEFLADEGIDVSAVRTVMHSSDCRSFNSALIDGAFASVASSLPREVQTAPQADRLSCSPALKRMSSVNNVDIEGISDIEAQPTAEQLVQSKLIFQRAVAMSLVNAEAVLDVMTSCLLCAWVDGTARLLPSLASLLFVFANTSALEYVPIASAWYSLAVLTCTPAHVARAQAISKHALGLLSSKQGKWKDAAVALSTLGATLQFTHAPMTNCLATCQSALDVMASSSPPMALCDPMRCAYVTVQKITMDIALGRALPVTFDLARQQLVTLHRSSQFLTIVLKGAIRFAEQLSGEAVSSVPSEEAAELRSIVASTEDEFEHHVTLVSSSVLQGWYYVNVVQSQYLLGLYPSAFALSNKTSRALVGCPEPLLEFEHHFFSALNLSALSNGSSPDRRAEYIGQLQQHIRELAALIVRTNASCSHRQRLLEAEVHRLQSKDASELYSLALAEAKTNGSQRDIAIVNECAAMYYLAEGDDARARGHLLGALDSYASWGAYVKVHKLQRQFISVLHRFGAVEDQVAKSVVQSALAGLLTDKFSIDLLMRVTMDFVGAQRAFFLAVNEENLELVAEAHVDKDVIVDSRQKQPTLLEESDELSSLVVLHCVRTSQPVYFENAAAPDGEFALDPYIKRNEPKSLLCCPVVHEEQVAFVLYFENNLIPSAFTADTVRRMMLFLGSSSLIERINIDLAHSAGSDSVSAAPSRMPETVLKKGYLTKRGGFVKSWKKRLFVLGNRRLCYYDKEPQPKLLGGIDLRDVITIDEVVVDSKEGKELMFFMPKGEFCFKIETSKRLLYCCAPERAVFDDWLIRIRAQIKICTQDRRYLSFSATSNGVKFDMKDLQLESVIGTGGFGKVYKGTWRGTEVAVKKLYVELTDLNIRQFQHEAALMSGLRHPNIVLFMAAVSEPPNLCIITEFMRKGSLYNILTNMSIDVPWHRRYQIALDAASGMVYLHSAQPPIIHRDLKTDNLLVDENWVLKISDFGLTRLCTSPRPDLNAEPDEMPPEPGRPGGEMTGNVGSVRYTAPEVLSAQYSTKYTEKADVYSFGMVLYEICTRKRPFFELKQRKLIENEVKAGKRPPIPSNCPLQMKKLIVECWQELPLQRPTFTDIYAQLKAIVQSNS